ncbi:Maf family nucleotide pyrophosphatase [Bartonella machadoae]|uniref:Maf family nucleotide pyrophosphatase n=1 Tax=Bartonella machadoae TaxID=2893471 RepID=UPI001F4CCAD2|nr:Maf family nucleotide pyrophosphatase [Bartonella machadoae]UNE53855.1 Maf family nucleotide pyrophosphatase [Bartonella machadoae]
MQNLKETFLGKVRLKKNLVQETQLVLASASPRRLALLAQIGLDPHYVHATNIDETPKLKEHPANLAKRLAREKALKAQKTLLWGKKNSNVNLSVEKKAELLAEKTVILAADTVVAVGNVIFPKPESEDEAYECLRFLSGRSHKVYGGICALNDSGKIVVKLVESRVRFKRLTAPVMRAYLASGEWQGKAGGYAIQGKAGAFVVNIVGSYSNVVGLPLAETMDLLLAYRFPLLENWAGEQY